MWLCAHCVHCGRPAAAGGECALCVALRWRATRACSQLEDKNLRHACGEMQKHLDGSVALDFPVSAFVSPKPDQLSDFVKIDEKACLDYRDDAGAAKLAARRAAAAHAIRRVAPARGAASA